MNNNCARCNSNNTTTYNVGNRRVTQCLTCTGRFVGDDCKPLENIDAAIAHLAGDDLDLLIEAARRDLDDECKPLENIDAAIARLDGGALPLLSSFPVTAERDALARDTGLDADRIAITSLADMEAWLRANNTVPPDWGDVEPSRRVLVFPIPNSNSAVIGLNINMLLSSTAS